MKNITSVLALSLTLAACGAGNYEEPVPTPVYVLAANATAQANANLYIANSMRFTNWTTEVVGDEVQSKDCPQGDGWAKVKFIAPQGVTLFGKSVYTLQCPTSNKTDRCSDETPNDGVTPSAKYLLETGRCNYNIQPPV